MHEGAQGREWENGWSDHCPAVVNSIATVPHCQRGHVRFTQGRARLRLWSQQSTSSVANMANLRWRCVDLASLAIAFSKRDSPIEMEVQRTCTMIEINMMLFGATSRIVD